MCTSNPVTSTFNKMNETQNILSDLKRKRANYPTWGYNIVGSILLFVAVGGTLTNAVSLRIFARNKHLHSPSIILVMGLSVCDLCMAVFGIPLSCVAAFAGKWNTGYHGCQFSAFICYVFGFDSVYLLAMLGVERYIVIAKPKWSKGITPTERSAVLAVLTCGAIGLVFGLFPLFGWNGYGLELSGVSCGLQYHDDSWTSKSFIIFVAVTCFLLPVSITMFCYCKIFTHIRSVNRADSMLVGDRYVILRFKMERKFLRTCIAMVGSFWVCWTPYAIVSFWQAFGNMDDLPLTLTILPAVAAKSQLVFDPLIYVATNTQFRQVLLESLPCAEGGSRDQPANQMEMQTSQITKVDIKTCIGP